jgi:beta-lactamase class A
LLRAIQHRLMSSSSLEAAVNEIVERSGVQRAGVALYDYRSGEGFAREGEAYFHAASTIKLAVLLAVFKAAEEKRLRLDDFLHVRNRFLSVADGTPYRLERERDACEVVHDRIGRNMHIDHLARHMITVSSNLATNLLLDYVGVDYAKNVLAEAGIAGVRLVRGVEDTVAHERGINNEVTAAGLVGLCRVIEEGRFITAESRARMLEIMSDQKFNAMIPARLPEGTRVAHKTGEISNACHDAGIVYPRKGEPYVVAILTEVGEGKTPKAGVVAEISEAVYRSARGEGGER